MPENEIISCKERTGILLHSGIIGIIKQQNRGRLIRLRPEEKPLRL
jgi:hypothetical protein